MKRLSLALIAGAVLVGLMTSQAMATDEVAKPIARIHVTERYSWGEFGRDLGRLRADLALAEARIFGGGDWRQEMCRFQSLERPLWTDREEHITAACVAERWPVPGGLSQLTAVASCESGWWRFAKNGSYRGLFQHSATYWPGRTSLVPERWRIGNWGSIWNSRTQLIVSARMARADGSWAGDWAGCA